MPPKKQISFTIPDHLAEQVEKFSSSQQELFRRAIDKSMKDFLANNKNNNDRENYSSSKSIALEDFLKQGESSDAEFESLKKELAGLPDIEFSDEQYDEKSEKEKLKKTLQRYSNASDEELDEIVAKASASLPAPAREKFSSSASSSASSSEGSSPWDYVIQENNRKYRERREKDIHRGL
jgi:Iap family predicted aminopeptidase